jgi:hypothetical protein
VFALVAIIVQFILYTMLVGGSISYDSLDTFRLVSFIVTIILFTCLIRAVYLYIVVMSLVPKIDLPLSH